MIADAFVQAHTPGDFTHIRAELFTDIRDLIDEGDTGGQEGIGRVFDHFSGAQVGDHDVAAQGLVKLCHHFSCSTIDRAKNNPIRVHEIIDRRALAQEFGVGNHAELQRIPVAAAVDHIRYPVTGSYRHCGFIDHQDGLLNMICDRFCSRANVLQISFTITAGWRTHSNERVFCAVEGFFIFGGKE